MITEKNFKERLKLVYILMNRNGVLSHQKLIETFGNDESRNPEGALKNSVYRLRNILKDLGSENYINTLTDAYQWNLEIAVESDYERFENLGKRMKKAGTEELIVPGTESPTGSAKNSPKTGDSTPIALWLTLLLASLAAITVSFRRKKRTADKE